jgi:hypothetical protein
MTEHPGVRNIPDAELTDYDRELIARIGAGWLPEFAPDGARSGAAARAYGRQLLADALGGPADVAAILGEDDDPAEPLPVALSAAERRGVAAAAAQAGASEGDIVRQAVGEYLTRRASSSGHAA